MGNDSGGGENPGQEILLAALRLASDIRSGNRVETTVVELGTGRELADSDVPAEIAEIALYAFGDAVQEATAREVPAVPNNVIPFRRRRS